MDAAACKTMLKEGEFDRSETHIALTIVCTQIFIRRQVNFVVVSLHA